VKGVTRDADATEALAAIASALREAAAIAVVSHVVPDGDAIGSLLGTVLALQKIGKRCWAINDDPTPWAMTFLPGTTDIVTWATVPSNDGPGVILALDCSDLGRTGLERAGDRLFPDVPIVQIDHHATNTRYGSINFVDVTAASVGEVIYDLVQLLGVALDADIATCLLTTLYTDTGSFQYSNVTPRTFAVAEALRAAGGRHVEIAKMAFRRKRFATARLWGLALATLTPRANGRYVQAHVTLEMQQQCGLVDEGTEGIVEHMMGIDGTDIAALFREASDGMIRVSLRTSDAVDAGELALHFHGGGHPRAAGCTLPGPLTSAQERILIESLHTLG
jgi:phosphoesterase RecJ-like protein